jgi:hypothetical protein
MNNKNLPPEKTRRAGHLLHHTGKNTWGNSKEPPERDPEPMRIARNPDESLGAPRKNFLVDHIIVVGIKLNTYRKGTMSRIPAARTHS